MYFQTFRPGPTPAIPADVVYTVEHLISQILTTADQRFLQTAVAQQRLALALFEELEFFGQVPGRYLSKVKEYLISQEDELRGMAERILKEPENAALREALCQPSALSPT